MALEHPAGPAPITSASARIRMSSRHRGAASTHGRKAMGEWERPKLLDHPIGARIAPCSPEFLAPKSRSDALDRVAASNRIGADQTDAEGRQAAQRVAPGRACDEGVGAVRDALHQRCQPWTFDMMEKERGKAKIVGR